MVRTFGWEKRKGAEARKEKSTKNPKNLRFIERPPFRMFYLLEISEEKSVSGEAPLPDSSLPQEYT
jgi:hypothetical protein